MQVHVYNARNINCNFAITITRTVGPNAIFVKKIGSGTQSDTKFGWRWGSVSYINAKKKKKVL
jgi:hypothetical protein